MVAVRRIVQVLGALALLLQAYILIRELTDLLPKATASGAQSSVEALAADAAVLDVERRLAELDLRAIDINRDKERELNRLRGDDFSFERYRRDSAPIFQAADERRIELERERDKLRLQLRQKRNDRWKASGEPLFDADNPHFVHIMGASMLTVLIILAI